MPLDPVSLHRDLLRIPSVSGDEARKVAFLERFLSERGCPPFVSGRNLLAARGRGERTLMLSTHTDTVPAGPSWTRDPHGGELIDGNIHGLGATDAHGALAGMIVAFLDARFDESRASLLLSLTCDEETGGHGLEEFIADIHRRHGVPGAVVVGEPTDMRVALGQRGLVRLATRARGRACHASRPEEGENALLSAARDILAADRVLARLSKTHPVLGGTTLAPTIISGGTKPNVIPDMVETVWDMRTAPPYANDQAVQAFRAEMTSEVEVRSKRFEPVVVDPDAAIVRAALDAAGAGTTVFRGVSDLFWAKDSPGIICGPGKSAQSHTADEFIAAKDVVNGARGYRRIIETYFGLSP